LEPLHHNLPQDQNIENLLHLPHHIRYFFGILKKGLFVAI